MENCPLQSLLKEIREDKGQSSAEEMEITWEPGNEVLMM